MIYKCIFTLLLIGITIPQGDAKCKGLEIRADRTDLCGSLKGSAVAECLEHCTANVEGSKSAECRPDDTSAFANSTLWGADFNITSNECYCCSGGMTAANVKINDAKLNHKLPGILLRSPPKSATCPASNIPSRSFKCDFTKSPCKWSLSGSTNLAWNYGRGNLDSEKLGSLFGVKELPEDDFLVLHAQGGTVKSSESASITTCPILCTKSLLKISVRHWQTAGVQMELCFHDLSAPFDSDLPPLDLCVPMQRRKGDRPGADVEVLPEGEQFSISLKATNMKPDSIVILDDIKIDYERCDAGTFDVVELSNRAISNEDSVSLEHEEEVEDVEEEGVEEVDEFYDDEEEELSEELADDKSTELPENTTNTAFTTTIRPKITKVARKLSSAESKRFSRLSTKPSIKARIKVISSEICHGNRGMLLCKTKCVRGLGKKFTGYASCDGGECQCNQKSSSAFSNDDKVSEKEEEDNTVCATENGIGDCARYCHSKHGGRLRRVQCRESTCVCEPFHRGGRRQVDDDDIKDQHLIQVQSDPRPIVPENEPAHNEKRNVKILVKREKPEIPLLLAQEDDAIVSAFTTANGILLEALCALSTCSFENANLCGWRDMSLVNDVLKAVRVRSGRTGNVVTGVRNAEHGKFYATFELDELQISALALNTTGLNKEDVILQMNVYDAVNEAQLRVCINDLNHCEELSQWDATIDAIQWQKSYVEVPAHTDMIYIFAENHGRSNVIIGLDHIELYYATAQTKTGDLKVKC